ncbi:MAG: hypothetical protein V4484_16865 [Pseudomonadota bacterium]
MKRAVAASALSGLVFPGAGQLYLGYRRRGWLTVAAVVIALLYFVAQVMGPVQALVTDIELGRVAPDPATLLVRVHEMTQALLADPRLNWAGALLIALWVASTVDAFLLGQRVTPD